VTAVAGRPETPSAHTPRRGHAGFTAYVRWATLAVVVLYGAGYSTVGFALLFCGALWSVLRRRAWPWAPTSVDLPLGVFAAILLLSASVSPYRPLASEITLLLLLSGAVYFGGFAWLLFHDPGSRGTLLRAWAAASPVWALVGIAYSLSHFERNGDNRMAPVRAQIFHWCLGRGPCVDGVGPNGLGTTLLLGGVIALGLALSARGRARACWLGCAAISLMGLLASGSRASLVGAVVGAAYLVWRELRGQPRRMAAILAGGLVALALVGAASPQLGPRIRYTLSDVSGNRLRIWHTSLEMIAARPLLGTGFGTFETAYDQRKDPAMNSEPFAFDMALNLAVETGLLGLLAALWVAVRAAREWQRRGRAAPPGADPLQVVIVASWLALLVDQFADNTLFSISTSAGLWLLLALVAVPMPEACPPGRSGDAPAARA